MKAAQQNVEKIRVRLGFEEIPKKHSGEGEERSPPISLGEVKSPFLAIIMDDPDCPSGTFVHWVIWNIERRQEIPGDVPKEKEPKILPGARQGINSGRQIGYMGPYPPRGSRHRYFFKVYGLDSALDLKPGATKADLERAMEGHVQEYGEAMATYVR